MARLKVAPIENKNVPEARGLLIKMFNDACADLMSRRYNKKKSISPHLVHRWIALKIIKTHLEKGETLQGNELGVLMACLSNHNTRLQWRKTLDDLYMDNSYKKYPEIHKVTYKLREIVLEYSELTQQGEIECQLVTLQYK